MKHQPASLLLSFLLIHVLLWTGYLANGFVVPDGARGKPRVCSVGLCLSKNNARSDHDTESLPPPDTQSKSLAFEDTDVASKGIVSSLTNLVNSWSSFPSTSESGTRENTQQDAVAFTATTAPPTNPQELLQRIQSDYQDRNYLWTGNIDLPCFDPQCRYQDPTLSFVGRDQFVKNVQNLQPIVDALVTQEQSILLDIQLNEEQGFVQTRWNMVGDFSGLFWKPRLDVIGCTKFWYQTNPADQDPGQPSYSVYFYDEEWEIPAYQALLQLFIPSAFLR